MILNNVSRSEWLTIADMLANVCERIATDPGEPLEEVPENDPRWPTGSIAVECFSAVNRAALLALFCAAVPNGTMEQLHGALEQRGRAEGSEA